MEFKTSDEQSNKGIPLVTINEVKKLRKNHVTQATSTTNIGCSVVCDKQSVAMNMSTSDVTLASTEFISTSRKGSLKCEFSSINSKSDHASTTLVWQNLIVKTGEDKRKEFFQRLRLYK